MLTVAHGFKAVAKFCSRFVARGVIVMLSSPLELTRSGKLSRTLSHRIGSKRHSQRAWRKRVTNPADQTGLPLAPDTIGIFPVKPAQCSALVVAMMKSTSSVVKRRDVCDGKKMEMFFDLHLDKELSLLSDCSTGGGALMVVALGPVALIQGRAVFGSACTRVRVTVNGRKTIWQYLQITKFGNCSSCGRFIETEEGSGPFLSIAGVWGMDSVAKFLTAKAKSKGHLHCVNSGR